MNANISMTLDEAVDEVLINTLGLELAYTPQSETYRRVARLINAALRNVALESEWGYYVEDACFGTVTAGMRALTLPSTMRLRAITDDSLRFVSPTGHVKAFAYYLPREALGKYANRTEGIWASWQGREIKFSRPIPSGLAGYTIEASTMREPRMYEIPRLTGVEEDEGYPEISEEERETPVDFEYPDLVVAKACHLLAMQDPVLQPRVQTLEQEYKNKMYALVERDTRATDTVYVNEWNLPISGELRETRTPNHGHPHSDNRWTW